MVFAANAVEGSSKSFEAFAALAKQLNGTSSNTTSSNTTSSNGTAPTQSNAASTPAGQSAVALVALVLGIVFML